MNPLSLLKCVQYVCKLHVVFDKDTSLKHFDSQCTYCIGWGPQQQVLHNIWSLFFLRIYAILALLSPRIYCIKDIITLLYIMVRNASVHFFDWYHVSLATESKKDKWMVQPLICSDSKKVYMKKWKWQMWKSSMMWKAKAKFTVTILKKKFKLREALKDWTSPLKSSCFCIFLWCSAFWLKAMHSGQKWCIQELVLAYILKKKQIMLVGCSSVCAFPSFRCHLRKYK